MGPSCLNNPGQTTVAKKRALRLIHFAPHRSHAMPLFNHYNILPLNFQYCKSVCTIMHDVSNNYLICRQTFPTYFSILLKFIAIILGFQRQVVLTLNIPGQISSKIHFLYLVQEFGTVFLKVSEYFPNINLKFLCISSFYVFWNWRYLCWHTYFS